MQRQWCKYAFARTRGQINVTEIVESPCTCSVHHIGFIIFSYSRRAGISQFLKRKIRTRFPRAIIFSPVEHHIFILHGPTKRPQSSEANGIRRSVKNVGKLSRKLLYTLDCSFRVTTVTVCCIVPTRGDIA